MSAVVQFPLQVEPRVDAVDAEVFEHVSAALQARAANSTALHILSDRFALAGLLRCACDAYGVSLGEVTGRRRTRPLANARRLFAVLARHLRRGSDGAPLASYCDIGAAVLRDHTSMIHSVEEGEAWLGRPSGFGYVQEFQAHVGRGLRQFVALGYVTSPAARGWHDPDDVLNGLVPELARDRGMGDEARAWRAVACELRAAARSGHAARVAA